MNTCTYQIQTFKYTPSKKVKTLEERKEEFRGLLHAYTRVSDPNCEKWPSWLRKDFFEYWTSLNDGGRKMYFEMEKKWNTGLRLNTWKRNSAKDSRWQDSRYYYEWEEVLEIHHDGRNRLKQQDFKQVDKLDNKNRPMWVKR